MTRAENRKLWALIAAGGLERGEHGPVDLHQWIRDVAAAVLEADTVPAGLRPGEIVRAVGLLGRDEPDLDLREAIELVLEFPIVGEDGKHRAPKRGEDNALLIAIARNRRPTWDSLTDDEIRKRLARIRSNDRKV